MINFFRYHIWNVSDLSRSSIIHIRYCSTFWSHLWQIFLAHNQMKIFDQFRKNNFYFFRKVNFWRRNRDARVFFGKFPTDVSDTGDMCTDCPTGRTNHVFQVFFENWNFLKFFRLTVSDIANICTDCPTGRTICAYVPYIWYGRPLTNFLFRVFRKIPYRRIRYSEHMHRLSDRSDKSRFSGIFWKLKFLKNFSGLPYQI